MEICNVPPLFWALLFLSSFISLFLSPSIFSSALRLSDHRHPHHGNASDEEALLAALLAFLSAITYDPSQNITATWKRNVSFCEWTGVTCSRRRQRVVSLDVSSMELQGTISPLLGNLSFLRTLDLSNNSFHGHISYQFGNLFSLKKLYFYRNQLQGPIPPTLARCRRLLTLSLGDNNLLGNIPYELICDLPKLQFLGLQYNNLTGRIPACLGNISTTFTEAYAPGSVTLDSEILLGDNHLIGQIPASFSNFTNLRILDITLNQLSGHIPGELCRKSMRLTQLDLGLNQLSSSIPASLFNCTNLQVLDLSGNQLRGMVPIGLGKLTELQILFADSNQLVSSSTTDLPILTALANCSALRQLDLSDNHLSGRLPSSVGHLSRKIDLLYLKNNRLVGEIPPQIGNLTNLTQLSLAANSFTGAIPVTLRNLQNLQTLFMGENNLQGNVKFVISTQLKTTEQNHKPAEGISHRFSEKAVSV